MVRNTQPVCFDPVAPTCWAALVVKTCSGALPADVGAVLAAGITATQRSASQVMTSLISVLSIQRQSRQFLVL